jgi:hypothetical protein
MYNITVPLPARTQPVVYRHHRRCPDLSYTSQLFSVLLLGAVSLGGLIGSLLFYLGLLLILPVNSDFASETTPSDSRNNSQIFLNAL